MTTRLAQLLVCATVLLGGCAAVMPALQTLAVAFGQDLLAAAAVNHAPRYAIQVEALLATLARQATGMNFQPKLVHAGYQTPLPRYLQQQQQRAQQQYGYPGEYGNGAQPQNDPYGTQAQSDPYGTQSQNDPYATQPETDPYAEPVADPYENQDQADPYGQPEYAAEDPYANSDTNAYEDPYSTDYGEADYGTRSANSPVSLGVALMVQRAGTVEFETIEDGARLIDGRGDPGRGDLIKVHFRSNCDCYIYVIGIDATGYVAQIFPDPDSADASSSANPVRAGQDYLLPGAGEYWALDDQRGVENVYFIAARQPRADIEQTLSALASEPRTRSARDNARAVRMPATIPETRGMVKVSVRPVSVDLGNRVTSITPEAFVSTLDDVDLIVSRWFQHE